MSQPLVTSLGNGQIAVVTELGYETFDTFLAAKKYIEEQREMSNALTSYFPQIDSTPWRIGGPRDFYTALWPIEQVYGVHSRVAFAGSGNAEFVVLACNSYDDTQKALKDARLALDMCARITSGDLRAICQNTLRRVEQALEKSTPHQAAKDNQHAE